MTTGLLRRVAKRCETHDRPSYSKTGSNTRQPVTVKW